ncbi:hypothetical protein OG978_33590 [Streptomyces sp. NBC_01591]|uniref:hypothetical protein n=1 Tax=Streptomyces sp. NBC_01591 TaxID=2975888 RepID=UPI002DD91D0C|nr:hypothetical protein [Streptomyces sp. NBC_01591]WSD71895.1 hypothetical protein OG978_33590 [Streptomyces sp. NBC_01591]
MTAAPRPLPPHGSEGRYKGTQLRPGCRCTVCVRGNRLAGIRRERVRLAGQSNLIPVEVLAAHIATLSRSGMSQGAIGRAADVSQTTISYIVNGKLRSCQRSKGERILAVRPGTRDDISDQPVLASARRLQALYAIGHGQLAISSMSDINHSTVSHVVNGRYKTVNGAFAARVRAVYSQLSRTPGTSEKARQRAAREGWAPPAAWDDDTIDDPAAVADWTGACGTDRGWWMHTLQKLPMCEPCRTAHDEWKAEHRGLPRGEFQIALMASRASASSRGIDIATDARELMRLGCDYEQAAARLGVTRQHLHQELKRHPETAQAA